MCEKRARLLIIQALLQSEPSNTEKCKHAFEQFADNVVISRSNAVTEKRQRWRSLMAKPKQSTGCPRGILETPLLGRLSKWWKNVHNTQKACSKLWNGN